MPTLPSVCFLLGLPRSGTTLLAHLLQQHRDLLAPPEPWLMLSLEAFGKVDRDHVANADLVRMATDEFLGRIDRNKLYRTFADAAYSQYLSKTGKKCFIDKTPRYWMVLDLIDAIYPDAPQIVLLRNPYAIAASLKTTWNIPLLLENCGPLHAPHLADLILGARKLAGRRHRQNVQVVCYETLVEQPEAEVSRLTAGLGFDPERQDSVTAEQVDYLRQGTFGDRQLLSRGRIDGSSIDAWTRVLTLEEKQAVTDMVGPDLIRELGYGKDLDQALEAGAIEKNGEAERWHQKTFEIWWQLRTGDRHATLPADPTEGHQSGEPSTFRYAMQLATTTAERTKAAPSLRTKYGIGALLKSIFGIGRI